MNFIKKHKGFIFLLVIILLWIISLFFISPEEIVSAMGIEAGYLVMFLTAFIGVSGFFSAPFYMSLITLTSTGEFNIFFIILIIAPARAFGDSIFFLLGHKGHESINELAKQRLKSFSVWLNKKPAWLIPVVAYAYTALSPLPQDILMFILGLGKPKFGRIFIAILLGNATFVGLVYFFSVFLFPKIFI